MRKEGHTNQYLPKLQMEYYNVMIDNCNIFCQPIKNYTNTFQNNWNITTGQVDDYTTSCLLYCHYFKEKYRLIEIDLSI